MNKYLEIKGSIVIEECREAPNYSQAHCSKNIELFKEYKNSIRVLRSHTHNNIN